MFLLKDLNKRCGRRGKLFGAFVAKIPIFNSQKSTSMKKLSILLLVAVAVFVLSNCSSSKKAATPPPRKMTYATDLQPAIMANCSPCHVPSKGGNKKAYD